MRLRCKPGDLCVIVGASRRIENIGRFASIEYALGEFNAGDTFTGPDGRKKVTHRTGFYWWVSGNGFVVHEDGTTLKHSHIADRNMRPLRDPGDDAVDHLSLVRRKPEEETA